MKLSPLQPIQKFRATMLRIGLCVLILVSASSGAELFDETRATTLFAFDNVSIPHSQNLRL